MTGTNAQLDESYRYTTRSMNRDTNVHHKNRQFPSPEDCGMPLHRSHID